MKMLFKIKDCNDFHNVVIILQQNNLTQWLYFIFYSLRDDVFYRKHYIRAHFPPQEKLK